MSSGTETVRSIRVYLYDESGRIPGGGTLVRPGSGEPDIAAFSPWPARVRPSSTLTLGVLDPSGTDEVAWQGASAVEVFGLKGAGARGQVGAVTLATPLGFDPGRPTPQVSRADLTAALATSPADIAAALTGLATNPFRLTAGRSTSRIPSASPSPALLSAPASFEVRTGNASEMAAFLCRIFHWD